MKAINSFYSTKAKTLVSRGRNLSGNAPKTLRVKFKSLKGQISSVSELGWENLTLKKIFRQMKNVEKNPDKANSFRNTFLFWFTNTCILREVGVKFLNRWIIELKKDGHFKIPANKVEEQVTKLLDDAENKAKKIELLRSIESESEKLSRFSHFQAQRISDIMFQPVGARHPNICGFMRHEAINQRTIIDSRVHGIIDIVTKLKGQLNSQA